MNYLFAILLYVQSSCEKSKCVLTFCLQVESEVSRLEHLKLSKMKELILKKRLELENECRRAHMSPEASGVMFSVEDIESRKTSTLFINIKDCFCKLHLATLTHKRSASSRKGIH